MIQQNSLGMKTNLAASLCYALGWITGIFFLVTEKDNRFVRFHAWQSTIFFGFLTLLGTALFFVPFTGGYLVVPVAVLALSLGKILIGLTYNGETYSLPLIGKIAHQLAQPAVVASSGAPNPGTDNEMRSKTT